MDFSTGRKPSSKRSAPRAGSASSSAPAYKRRGPVLVILAMGGLFLFSSLCVLVLYMTFTSTPSPEKVVSTFSSEGLEVGDSHNLEDDPEFMASLTPKVYEEGHWFEIPSLTAREGEPTGGKVYTFDSKEDLEVMESYYESAGEMPIFGGALASHLYSDKRRLILVQIYGQLPKDQADLYGEVMEGTRSHR